MTATPAPNRAALRFSCPACQATLTLKVAFAGKKVACPKCQASIRVPTPARATQAKAVPAKAVLVKAVPAKAVLARAASATAAPATIEFACESCGQVAIVPREVAGKPGKCKACGAVNIVPGGPTGPLPAPEFRPDGIRFHCERCRQPMLVPKALAGLEGRCQTCQADVIVPGERPAARPVPVGSELPGRVVMGIVLGLWALVIIGFYARRGDAEGAALAWLRHADFEPSAMGFASWRQDRPPAEVLHRHISEVELLSSRVKTTRRWTTAEISARVSYDDGSEVDVICNAELNKGAWVFQERARFDKSGHGDSPRIGGISLRYLLWGLSHPRPEVRTKTLLIVTRVGFEGAAEPLESAVVARLDDPNSEVARLALRALAAHKVRSELIVPALTQGLQSEGLEPFSLTLVALTEASLELCAAVFEAAFQSEPPRGRVQQITHWADWALQRCNDDEGLCRLLEPRLSEVQDSELPKLVSALLSKPRYRSLALPALRVAFQHPGAAYHHVRPVVSAVCQLEPRPEGLVSELETLMERAPEQRYASALSFISADAARDPQLLDLLVRLNSRAKTVSQFGNLPADARLSPETSATLFKHIASLEPGDRVNASRRIKILQQLLPAVTPRLATSPPLYEALARFVLDEARVASWKLPSNLGVLLSTYNPQLHALPADLRAGYIQLYKERPPRSSALALLLARIHRDPTSARELWSAWLDLGPKQAEIASAWSDEPQTAKALVPEMTAWCSQNPRHPLVTKLQGVARRAQRS